MTHPLDDCLWISWIDREGAICSSGFSFFDNLPLLLVLLLALQRFGRSQWGHISELATESHSVPLHPVDADGTLCEGEVAVNFYPGDRVHSGWALPSRAITVVGAKADEEDDIKNSPTVRQIDADQQQGEGWDAFYRSRNKYREAYAETIRSHGLVLKVSWPETSRVEEWKIIGHAQTLGKNDKFIKGHIPEVKYAGDFNRYSTEHVRRFLGLPQDERPGTRTLRLTVMKRLWPIYNLDGEQFWGAFWQCVACMWPYTLSLIIH